MAITFTFFNFSFNPNRFTQYVFSMAFKKSHKKSMLTFKESCHKGRGSECRLST